MTGISVSGMAVATAAEDAADRPLRGVQLVAEPLDPVREQLGGDQDDRQRADQEDDVHPSGDDYGRRCCGAYSSSATVGPA